MEPALCILGKHHRHADAAALQAPERLDLHHGQLPEQPSTVLPQELIPVCDRADVHAALAPCAHGGSLGTRPALYYELRLSDRSSGVCAMRSAAWVGAVTLGLATAGTAAAQTSMKFTKECEVRHYGA